MLKSYNLPVGAHLAVNDKDRVAAGDIIVKIPRAVGKSGDITGGLPRVTELFEARNPSNPAVVSEIDGEVSFGQASIRDLRQTWKHEGLTRRRQRYGERRKLDTRSHELRLILKRVELQARIQRNGADRPSPDSDFDDGDGDVHGGLLFA
jgi:hypothetical protein